MARTSVTREGAPFSVICNEGFAEGGVSQWLSFFLFGHGGVTKIKLTFSARVSDLLLT